MTLGASMSGGEVFSAFHSLERLLASVLVEHPALSPAHVQ